jgi:hypothetical protein
VLLSSVSDWRTQCIGVLGTRLVEVPMMLPSMNRQKFGFHSLAAVC